MVIVIILVTTSSNKLANNYSSSNYPLEHPESMARTAPYLSAAVFQSSRSRRVLRSVCIISIFEFEI